MRHSHPTPPLEEEVGQNGAVADLADCEGTPIPLDPPRPRRLLVHRAARLTIESEIVAVTETGAYVVAVEPTNADLRFTEETVLERDLARMVEAALGRLAQLEASL